MARTLNFAFYQTQKRLCRQRKEREKSMNYGIMSRINRRALIVFFFMIAVCAVIVARLFYMQIIDYKHYQSLVIENIQQETSVPATRGVIYSNNMVQLATNKTAYRIFVSLSFASNASITS